MSSIRIAWAGPFVLAALLAGCFNPSFREDIQCGPDQSCPPGLTCVDGACRGGGAIDAPVIDAPADAPVDAPSVACTGDPDCLTPPTPCFTAGTCDLTAGMCVFGVVDCSSMTDGCNVGVCNGATGACEAQPSNEGLDCNGGRTCGAYTPCGSFGDVCDSTGTQTRECTTSTCQSGTCVAATVAETADCTRVTEDVDCQADTVTGCGACGGFAEPCGEGGSQTCTCTDFKCRSDVCAPVATACVQGCARDTDGASCGSPTTTGCSSCAYASSCAESAPDRTCTCNTFTCVNGGCATSSSSCAQACARDTDGNECGCIQCPAGEGGRVRECTNGTCLSTNVCGSC
jgi:hypothetical protein